ncbi:MmcQ/YjbR family DNA-binding protein [Pedobacter sandarakinus]|uniref:MmcQ/YjbR family DNA-binding protein n=1 Tax=Pedobacter sandarakinus TaxID=353156 RepID=UPI0022473407|nr:MmcQ/YjbR family DNA-binding protein [Pedobacter sandarakinus]MCX2575413.1 MmcQ/YjbR family DNA-binding protein [Pedobacter sandarakinus]
MDIESFRDYCLSLPGTTEGMKWGHLCFMIEEKIYLIIAIDNGNKFSIKCDPNEFDTLTARDGIAQAYHLAKRQWIQVENLEVLYTKELKERVATSRALVLAKLPKKIQALYVGLNGSA